MDLIRTRQILKEARDIWVEDPLRDGWLASDKDGNGVSPDDTEACKWCAIGAICKVSGREYEYEAEEAAIRVLRDVLGSETGHQYDLARFNDSGMLTVRHWNKAIERLGGEP